MLHTKREIAKFADVDFKCVNPESRLERVKKESHGKQFVKSKFAFGCIEFSFEGNLGLLVRTAACYNMDIHVIGSIPESRILREKSASTAHLINIIQYSTPGEFLRAVKGKKIVAAELSDRSIPLNNYTFSDEETILFVGNESVGISEDILMAADCVEIPMIGPAPCLNVTNAAAILVWEAHRQLIHK